MDVFGRVVGLQRSVLSARRNHRDLARERHERFQDQRHAAHCRPDTGGVRGRGIPEHALALAVIAQPAGLQHAVAAERGERRREIAIVVHSKMTGCGYSGSIEEALFGEPVLRDLERGRRRTDGN